MEWQPIETAPRDGTDIIIAEIRFKNSKADYGEIDIGSWEEDRNGADEFGDSYFCWMSNYGRVEEPTHWMPLPPPPGKGAPDS